MSNVNLGLILAAGNGSRLASVSESLPKPLIEVHGKPLLEHVLLDARQAGIRRFVIVVGYRGDLIQSWFETRHFHDIQVSWVENPDYRNKSNGISVLKARDIINESFVLFMSDHMFETETVAKLIRQPVAHDETMLAVDHKLECIFDMDDATKVSCNGNYITAIGKEIKPYDAIDTGMFLCRPGLFRWLELATINGNCSLSDGMALMAAHRKLRAFDIGDAMWQDVDTPDALNYAQRLFLPSYSSNYTLGGIASV
jgi:1L-myo-inositol 1-phosphate cytidylyltransferase / CDP-L-myo-inositol myo-inositolphosphotransferase